jgi:molybdopterin converting factor small subunit
MAALQSAFPDPLRVRVLLFGAFRDLADGGEIFLAVPRGTTVSELRRELREVLARSPAHGDLLEASALALEGGLLTESQALGEGVDEVRVAILPPVCGG